MLLPDGGLGGGASDYRQICTDEPSAKVFPALKVSLKNFSPFTSKLLLGQSVVPI